MKLFIAILLSAMLAVPAQADITWNVTFNDGTSSVGFGTGSALGQTRRDTFQAALDYISSVLDTPNDVTLDYTVEASQIDGSGALASAGTSFFTAPGFTNGILFEHAQTGTDPASIADGTATFDFGYNWNSENDAPTSSEFDLFTVSLHEVTHSLGFLSLTNATGTSRISNGVHSVLDSFLERGNGDDLFDSNANFLGTAADLISEDVFFNGANAMAANGGSPVQMNAPTSFSEGSSLSHVDSGAFPNAIMTPAIAPGVRKAEYTGVDIGILRDLGWSIQAVPEPNSILLVAFFGGALLVRRNRK